MTPDLITELREQPEAERCLRNQLTTLTAELAEAKGKLARAVECLTACKMVLTPATLDEMGGTPDLFCPDVEAHGFICEPGEDYWDTWDRYAQETLEEITAILQDNPGGE